MSERLSHHEMSMLTRQFRVEAHGILQDANRSSAYNKAARHHSALERAVEQRKGKLIGVKADLFNDIHGMLKQQLK